MANNYVQFCEELSLKSAEERAWFDHATREVGDEIYGLDSDAEDGAEKERSAEEEETAAAEEQARYAKILKEEPWREDDDYELCCNFVVRMPLDGSSALFDCDESGDPEAVAVLIHAFFKKFRPDGYFEIGWATTCSKSRPGEFGGGTYVVTAQEMRHYGHTGHVKKFFEKHGRLPRRRTFKRQPMGGFKDKEPEEIIEERGWSEQTMLVLYERFIEEPRLGSEFQEYLAAVAHTEAAEDFTA